MNPALVGHQHCLTFLTQWPSWRQPRSPMQHRCRVLDSCIVTHPSSELDTQRYLPSLHAGLTKVPIDGQPKSIVKDLEDMARTYIKVSQRTDALPMHPQTNARLIIGHVTPNWAGTSTAVLHYFAVGHSILSSSCCCCCVAPYPSSQKAGAAGMKQVCTCWIHMSAWCRVRMPSSWLSHQPMLTWQHQMLCIWLDKLTLLVTGQ